MIYRKLKRTWSHSYAHLPQLKKVFPELSKLNNEPIAKFFIDLKMDFYYEEETPVKAWVRITLPFAIILMLLMLLLSPIVFMFTGKWGYSMGKKNRILNWFKSLRLQ